jgi:ribosomal protein S18 acetylase RimI-like enzyme
MECRPVTHADAWPVARLLTQLYEVEAPGMLTGDHERSALLIRRALEHDGAAALLGTYYVLTRDGEPLGVGAVATSEFPLRRLWYPDLRTDARRLLGISSGRAFVRGLNKVMGAQGSPTFRQDAMLHNMVVDRGVRRKGVGAHLLRSLEDQAASRGKQNSVLHVRGGNSAERFYERFGYQIIRSTDGARWRRNSAYPSIVMRKPLFECAGYFAIR